MTIIIAGGRPGALPSLAALGAAASLTLSACSIPFKGGDDTRESPPAVEAESVAGAAGAVAAGVPDATDEAPDATQPTPDVTGQASDATEPTPDATGEVLADADDEDVPPPPFYANTLPDFGEATGDAASVLTGVHAHGSNDFDRIILQFAGPGTPGWHVRYVDYVVADPSGLELEIEGAAVLEATLTNVAHPEGDAGGDAEPSRVAASNFGAVTEVLVADVFEGRLQSFIGIGTGELPFRAYGLENPSRVVIEVQHPR